MRFSEAFGISRTASDDWFDPDLTVDTRLFIDPILLLEDGGEWEQAHAELINHFVACYRLVARSMTQNSVSARAARRLLLFPEPSEFGLGYTASSTQGAGAGQGFARTMADGIAVAIRAGLVEPRHIEEIGILSEGIGPDRISDAVANVLKHRFIEYTQAVAMKHGIPLDVHRVRHIRCNLSSTRWIDGPVGLPTNPKTGNPIVLVPQRLLNQMPTLNAGDWFDSSFNADLRGEMNVDIGRRVSRSDVIRVARQYPDRVRRWAEEQVSRPDLHGYDFGADPLGVVQWDREPVLFAQANPSTITRVASQADLSALVSDILSKFKHFIESQRGWSLLWNDDGSEKPESAAQLMFLGIARYYLHVFDVELDREVELGRGPVDFKASSGSSVKVLIEIKKAHNGKFWNGIAAQLPIYLDSDGCDEGWYVALQYRSTRYSINRIKELPARVRDVRARVGKDLKYIAVDARPKVSASKV